MKTLIISLLALLFGSAIGADFQNAESTNAKGKPKAITIPEPGFKPIFNGKDLTGWEGEGKAWVVRDGAIQSTGGQTKKNWLIWRGGELRDFELRLSFKFTKGNSGVQVRSKEIDKWQVRGYQVEIADATKMGLWHHSLSPEKYRSHLATVGQRVHIGVDGKKKIEQLAEAAKVQSVCRDNEWNELVIKAVGSRLVQKINGVVFTELIDEEAKYAAQSGLLALQDHGKGCVAAFKNIRIKHLKTEVKPSRSNTAKQTNFLFFLVDDMGWADIGANGSKFHETPHIDGLAASGMRFTQGYAACPVCSPTRASILTGRHPVRVDITDWIPGQGNRSSNPMLHPQDRDNLAHKEVTIAEALKKHDYQTFFAGKWHLGSEGHWPTDQGFDINIGGHHKGSPPGGYYAPWTNPALKSKRKGEYLTERLTEESVKFLEGRDGSKPFLLYLSYYNIHTPIQAYKKHIEKYQSKAAKLFEGKTPTKPEHEGINRMRQDNAALASMVAAVDDSVGTLLAKIKQLKLDENTVVIFFSDNGGLSTLGRGRSGPRSGPGCNLPLRAGKGWLYEGGVREPTLIRAPGITKPGSVSQKPMVSMDFFPTMLELAGLPAKPKLHIDGQSLVPQLKGNDSGKRILYWHYPHYHGSAWKPGASIRDGDWKLIELYHYDKFELYNLAGDPGEKIDLAKSNPKKATELRTKLIAWQKQLGAKMPVPNPDYNPDAKPKSSKPKNKKLVRARGNSAR